MITSVRNWEMREDDELPHQDESFFRTEARCNEKTDA